MKNALPLYLHHDRAQLERTLTLSHKNNEISTLVVEDRTE